MQRLNLFLFGQPQTHEYVSVPTQESQEELEEDFVVLVKNETHSNNDISVETFSEQDLQEIQFEISGVSSQKKLDEPKLFPLSIPASSMEEKKSEEIVITLPLYEPLSETIKKTENILNPPIPIKMIAQEFEKKDEDIIKLEALKEPKPLTKKTSILKIKIEKPAEGLMSDVEVGHFRKKHSDVIAVKNKQQVNSQKMAHAVTSCLTSLFNCCANTSGYDHKKNDDREPKSQPKISTSLIV